MKKILSRICIFFLITNFTFYELKAQIKSYIVAKVGNSIITSLDVQNEIIMTLVLSKQEINQENINNNKNAAIKNLIAQLIKESEIKKFKIENFNKKDLQDYVQKIEKSFQTDKRGLKKIFSQNNLNYDSLIEKHKIALLWNSLIYMIYNNQININVIEVENEVEKIKNLENIEYNLSEIEISKSEYSENKIKEILELISKEGFESTAKKISISSTAQNGGLIGWVVSDALSEKFLKKIKNTSINQITSVILNEDSFSFLKINNIKKDTNQVALSELKEKILSQRKNDKLALFSRSHFISLENSILIDFK
jgi:hypothetical protein|tara:strand:- start:72 stop:1001 length:930 start_codon:yes stop_codon:yes gene_type:complete